MNSKTIVIQEPGRLKVCTGKLKFLSFFRTSYYKTFLSWSKLYRYLSWSGLYPLPLPATIGMEGAGEGVEVGEGVALLKEGDKVVYALGPPGSYSDIRNIPEKKLIKIPDYVDEKTAAAIMLKGMTVEYLTERTFLINNSHTVLLHAAAGGVGQIATQWIKSKGKSHWNCGQFRKGGNSKK